MKIAIAKNGDYIANNFAFCNGFEFFDVEDNQIIDQQTIFIDGLQDFEIIKLLSNYKLDVLIASKVGENMKTNLEDSNVKILVGASGRIDKIINDYIEGTLSLK